jgi:hypothetical protein
MRFCTRRLYLIVIVVLLVPSKFLCQTAGCGARCNESTEGKVSRNSGGSTTSGGDSAMPDETSNSRPVKSAERTRPSPKPVPPEPNGPESLFDAARNRFKPVEVNVEVKAEERELESPAPEPFEIGGEEIITAAGSYGDIMRYLQVLPGVVATSDTSNEVLVRGGHPIENLYLVDGFEIPNINHLARLGSSGGFAPMIDSALVQSLALHTGGYGARFPDRLSSVTEINLLNSKNLTRNIEGDFGIQGIGGLVQSKIHQGDLLVSGHHGLLDVVTRNIGLDGVPSYTNELTRFRLAKSSGDTFTLLNIAGVDSLEITPCESDQDETSSINSQYSGWRETTGLNWQRLLSGRSFGILSVTDSEQIQHIHQEDQYVDPVKARVATIACPIPKNYVKTTPVYMEDTNSAVSSASYRYEWASSKFAISAGTTAWLQRPQFEIAQPEGIFSPYSSAPVRTDSTSISTRFSTGETGSFVDLSYRGIKNLSLGWGSRIQTIAFGGHTTVTSRVSARYRLGEYAAVNAAFATYAQMPPYIYLVSFQQNRALQPMRAHHKIIGLDFDAVPGSQIHVEAYDKPYSDTPAASEYPTMTLHNIPDQLGDEIVWLPMNSEGRGHASGIELSDTTRIRSKVLLKGSLAYSRAKFAGGDAILRPSNFDLPWILNLLSNIRIGKGYGVSSRYGYATGRPYTPYDTADSLAQNRPIYDLQRVNALRAPAYARLDAQMNKDISVRGLHLEIYAGVDNVLNRDNFLTFAWMLICELGHPDRDPVRELHQMPIFPNFGVRFILR